MSTSNRWLTVVTPLLLASGTPSTLAAEPSVGDSGGSALECIYDHLGDVIIGPKSLGGQPRQTMVHVPLYDGEIPTLYFPTVDSDGTKRVLAYTFFLTLADLVRAPHDDFLQVPEAQSSASGYSGGAWDGVWFGCVYFAWDGGIAKHPTLSYFENKCPTQVIIHGGGPNGAWRALAFDPTGDQGHGSLWSANLGSSLVEVSLGGTILRSFPNLDGWTLYAITFDTNTGNLWGHSTNGRVIEIDTSTGRVTSRHFAAGASLGEPGGISPRNLGSYCDNSLIAHLKGPPDRIIQYVVATPPPPEPTGACCTFPPYWCRQTTRNSCRGHFFGIRTDCPKLNTEDNLFMSHGTGLAARCESHVVATQDQVTSLGSLLVDPWVTVGGGTTFEDFSQSPIPAGFFAPESAAFSGIVEFESVPLGNPAFPEADTLIQRSGDPFQRCDEPSYEPSVATTDVVGLSLRGTGPITVSIGGIDTLWETILGFSECSPPSGTLTALKTHCNGGTYTATIHVQPKLTFVRQDDPTQVCVLDTGCDNPPQPYIVLNSPRPLPWVHDPDPRVPLSANYASAFHPAIQRDSQACGDFDLNNAVDSSDLAALLAAGGHAVGDVAYDSGIDFDADGVITSPDYDTWLCCFHCFVGDPQAPPPLGQLGDFNLDGRLDLRDIARMQECFLASGERAFACRLKFDFDGNKQINLLDIVPFEQVLTGP